MPQQCAKCVDTGGYDYAIVALNCTIEAQSADLRSRDAQVALLKADLESANATVRRLRLEAGATQDHFLRIGEMFQLSLLKQAITPIDWPDALRAYLEEVYESLEKTTYDNKRYWLGSWLKFLGDRQPTTAMINEYLTERYQSNKGTRNRVGRDIVMFSNRYLSLHAK